MLPCLLVQIRASLESRPFSLRPIAKFGRLQANLADVKLVSRQLFTALLSICTDASTQWRCSCVFGLRFFIQPRSNNAGREADSCCDSGLMQSSLVSAACITSPSCSAIFPNPFLLLHRCLLKRTTSRQPVGRLDTQADLLVVRMVLYSDAKLPA